MRLAVLALVGCSHWRSVGDVVAAAAPQIVLACDEADTLWGANGGTWERGGGRVYETNSYLGERPRPSTIAWYFAAWAIGAAAAQYLPRVVAWPLAAIVVVAEVPPVMHWHQNFGVTCGM